MKYLDQMAEGGYPFDDVSINYLQQMHNERDAFIAAILGDHKIAKGVRLNTETNLYSEGLITVGGKLYHFVGGAPQVKISKQTISTKRQYKDGEEKEAFINEFYEFGEAGTEAIDFSDLKRFYKNEPIYKETKDIGGSVTNSDLPEGWYIADGSNGTDDLRSKFIVGYDSRDADYNTVGKKGGSKKHALIASELPKTNSIGYIGEVGTGYPNGAADNTEVGGDHSYPRKSKTLKLDNFGANNQPHENRPPYYVVVKIQFIGV